MNGRSTTVTGSKFKLPHMRTTSSDLDRTLQFLVSSTTPLVCVSSSAENVSTRFATYSDVEVIRSDRFVNFKNRISLTLHLPIFVAVNST